MSVPSYHATCTGKTVIARDVFEFTFTKPENLTFKAGQFLLFDVPLLDNPADIQTRAYSIASAPGEKELLFVIKLVPGGRASRWFEQAVVPGTDVRMQGPFGAFVIDPKSRKDWLMIATGSGIAPYRSQLMETICIAKSRSKRAIDVVFGVRTEEDIFWRETFERFAAKCPSLRFHVTLSGGSERWQGHRGRVQTVVNGFGNFSGKHIFICGNPVMTKEVKEQCLQLGAEKKDVHVEGYV